MTMGFKSDMAEAFQDMDRRVTELETLASSLRQGNLPVVRNVGAYDGITGGRRASAVTNQRGEYTHSTTEATGVDYAAVAFGLLSMKGDIKSQFDVTDGQMATKWAGAVKYFTDVFAKSDPAFDAAEFARLAGA